ncbi:Nitrogen permease reactivator protein [Bulinus truncatus]|nr:Nitrogen permease reactivator protein [Bulinus truncatus]
MRWVGTSNEDRTKMRWVGTSNEDRAKMRWVGTSNEDRTKMRWVGTSNKDRTKMRWVGTSNEDRTKMRWVGTSNEDRTKMRWVGTSNEDRTKMRWVGTSNEDRTNMRWVGTLNKDRTKMRWVGTSNEDRTKMRWVGTSNEDRTKMRWVGTSNKDRTKMRWVGTSNEDRTKMRWVGTSNEDRTKMRWVGTSNEDRTKMRWVGTSNEDRTNMRWVGTSNEDRTKMRWVGTSNEDRTKMRWVSTSNEDRTKMGWVGTSNEDQTKMRWIRDISHTNLLHVTGAVLEGDKKMIIVEHCPKGSLQALSYLHKSPLRVHGRLTSEVCMIDSRFSVKVGFYGLPTINGYIKLLNGDEFKDQLWAAPEMLRHGGKPTQQGDVYSLAIIISEMLTREEPYSQDQDSLSTKEIIDRVKSSEAPPFRPTVVSSPDLLVMDTLMRRCWEEEPEKRPAVSSIVSIVDKMMAQVNKSGGLVDNLLQRLEKYSSNLEKIVDEKVDELRLEKEKSEGLLKQMLPAPVVERLKSGLGVEPEFYDCVTIYFSDIVEFTVICSLLAPVQIISLLNDLYSCFDQVLGNFDVYKVETIGDAYMVVSGLPTRNGNEHARQIAQMSLSLLTSVSNFTHNDLPQRKVKLRIGLNSGPVCAGVVGLKMPRYCLFGDSVNTASRMESNSEEFKIHMSGSTASILQTFGTFIIESRGEIQIKPKNRRRKEANLRVIYDVGVNPQVFAITENTDYGLAVLNHVDLSILVVKKILTMLVVVLVFHTLSVVGHTLVRRKRCPSLEDEDVLQSSNVLLTVGEPLNVTCPLSNNVFQFGWTSSDILFEFSQPHIPFSDWRAVDRSYVYILSPRLAVLSIPSVDLNNMGVYCCQFDLNGLQCPEDILTIGCSNDIVVQY